MKVWKSIDWGDECPECGGSVEVFADDGFDDNTACDGDEARCADCHYHGWAAVDEDEAWINWNEDEE